MNNPKNENPFWQMYIGVASFTLITFILMIVVGFNHASDSIIPSFDQTIQQPNNSIEHQYKETSIALQQENVKLIKSKQKLEDKIKKLTSILVKEHKSEKKLEDEIKNLTNILAEKHDHEKLVILQVDNRYTCNISELMTSNYLASTNLSNAGYWDQTRVINRIYADKFNYTYVSIKSSGNGRNSGMRAKVMETLHYLMNNSDVDWVLFLDSDAFVGDDEWDFKMVKAKFNLTDDIHMLIATERSFVNTGVYFVRNSEIGREIMLTWDNSIGEMDDQDAFNRIIMTNETYTRHIRVPLPWFKQEFVNFEGERWGGYHEAFIQHYFMGGMPMRVREIRKFVIYILSRASVKYFYNLPYA